MSTKAAILPFDWAPATVLAGRLCLSAIFLISGVGKLMSQSATIASIESVGLPFPSLSFAAAVAIELLCGAALVVGFKVRWSAGILAIFTVLTALFFHSAVADANQFTHFLKNVAITGGLLHVIVLGNQLRALP
jgi:putative oxidoreductase